MSRWYIGTDTGSKALAHYAKGASAKDHKWVSRSLKNGRWVYKYPVTTVDFDNGKISKDESKPGENTNDWMNKGVDSLTGYNITKSTKIKGDGLSAYLDEWKDAAGREGFTISAGFGNNLAPRYGYDENGNPYNSMAWYKDDAPEEYKYWNTFAQGKDPGNPGAGQLASDANSGSKESPLANAKKEADKRKVAGTRREITSAPSLDRVRKETAERKTIAARKAVQKQIQADVRNKVNAANAQKRYAELTKSSTTQKPAPSSKSHEVNSNGIKARPATAADAYLFKNKSSAETKNKVNISDHGGNTGIKTEVTKKKKKRL